MTIRVSSLLEKDIFINCDLYNPASPLFTLKLLYNATVCLRNAIVSNSATLING